MNLNDEMEIQMEQPKLEIELTPPQPERINRFTSTKFKPRKVNNFSGGAIGGDAIWSILLFKKLNKEVQNIHILPFPYESRFGVDYGKRKWQNGYSKNMFFINASEQENRIGQKLNKKIDNNTHNMNNRNYLQVFNADGIYAIGELKSDFSNVNGGTGSAIKLAVELNNSYQMKKDIYVLNVSDNNYYRFDFGLNKFKIVEIDMIKIYQFCAFIGTRKVSFDDKMIINEMKKLIDRF